MRRCLLTNICSRPFRIFSYGLATYAWTLRHAGDVDRGCPVAEKALELSSWRQFYVAGLALPMRLRDVMKMRVQRWLACGKVSSLLRSRLNHRAFDSSPSRRARTVAYPATGSIYDRRRLARLVGCGTQLDPLRGEPGFESCFAKREIHHWSKILTAAAVVPRRHKSSSTSTPMTSPVASPAPETQPGETRRRANFTRPSLLRDPANRRGAATGNRRLERAVEIDPHLRWPMRSSRLLFSA